MTITGPGHGAPGVLSGLWLEGSSEWQECTEKTWPDREATRQSIRCACGLTSIPSALGPPLHDPHDDLQ